MTDEKEPPKNEQKEPEKVPDPVQFRSMIVPEKIL